MKELKSRIVKARKIIPGIHADFFLSMTIDEWRVSILNFDLFLCIYSLELT